MYIYFIEKINNFKFNIQYFIYSQKYLFKLFENFIVSILFIL